MSSKMNDTGPILQGKFEWFDPRINLGHILTIIMVLGVGYAGWLDVQKRVTVLEDARVTQKQIYRDRIAAVDRRLDDLTTESREIRKRFDQLTDKKGTQ